MGKLCRLSTSTTPPPEEKVVDRQQPFAPVSPPPLLPPSPLPTGAEQPPEELTPNHEPPISKQPTSLSPSPPTGIEDHAGSPNYRIQPSPIHESPLKPPSPTPSTLPTGAEHPSENLSPNHESPISKLPPSPSTPPIATEDPVESADDRINPSPNNDSRLTTQPQSPSPSPPTPPTGPEDHMESHNHHINPSSKHESPHTTQPPSPSPPPTGPEYHLEGQVSPDYCINPNPNSNSDHESPTPSSPTKLQGNPILRPHQSPKDPSLSPPLTAGSPSSQPDHLEPNSNLPPPPSSPIKPQIISPWNHQETANLIQAYQEKWYSFKKGPLKAGQWEEIAITVAARCGYKELTKTAKRCRHKIEKLRKRYRSERGKPRSKATAWNFFQLMENLEKGPLPLSSQPMALVEYQKPTNSNVKKRKNHDHDDDDDGDDDDDEYPVNKRSSRSKNSNNHVANNGLTTNLWLSDGGNRVVRGLRTPAVHKPKGFYQDVVGGGEVEEGVAAQLAAEIKGFAEKFVKI